MRPSVQLAALLLWSCGGVAAVHLAKAPELRSLSTNAARRLATSLASGDDAAHHLLALPPSRHPRAQLPAELVEEMPSELLEEMPSELVEEIPSLVAITPEQKAAKMLVQANLVKMAELAKSPQATSIPPPPLLTTPCYRPRYLDHTLLYWQPLPCPLG